MRLLLDTHILLFALDGADRLRADVRGAIVDPKNKVFVSAASALEIVIKASIGKLDVPPSISDWLPSHLESNRFDVLAISLQHVLWVERLPQIHRDPFDRILIAQALAEELTIVTRDSKVMSYPVSVLPA